MYTAQAAIGVRFGLNKRWETIDLTQWTVAQLFQTFRICQLQLLAAGGTSPVYLDLSTLAAQYSTFTGSVSDMLTAIGDTTLQTTANGYTLNNRKAQYSDAFAAGYKLTPVTANNVIDATVPTTSLPNIRLTNPSITIDYTYFFQHCLVNVNGYYHLIDTDGINGVMVIDAMKSAVHSGQNQMGLFSFAGMCDLQYVPFSANMIDTSVSQMATVTLPQDMTGKNLIMFIGGYMVLVDGNVITQTAPSSYKIDFTKLSIVDRFYESWNYIDLSSLGLNYAPGNDQQVTISDLTTADTIKAWLALNQSFAVILDCPEMYWQSYMLKRSGLPQLYIGYQPPQTVMQLELGRHPPYWATLEDGQYALTIYDNVIGDKLYSTTPTPQWLSTAGSSMPGMPGHLSQAMLLEIGRDV